MLIVEHLLAGLKELCASFPDKRKGEGVYAMADIGMSAFSLFFMQSESFLEYQRALEERQATSNCHSLFGMARIPTDNHIRAMLDPVHPAHLQGAFDAALATLKDHGGLAPFQRLGGRCLIALDGTEYFCSRKLGCPNCQTRKRANGKIESYHSMLAASLVAPGHARVLPLMPEFIARPDGAEKQDCERNAVKRWLAAHGPRLQHLRPVYLGDDLFACQPIAEAMIQAGGDFLLTAKPASHQALYDFIAGATAEECTFREVQGGKLRRHHLRWFNNVPLRQGNDARLVNWIALTITDARGKITYQGAFITSLSVDKTNVAGIADCARARWKVENETFNVLKNNGYHLEHNFGHGKQNLAMMFAAMNLLAFAFHTVCDTIEELWIQARQAKKTRRRFFEHFRSITAYLVFPSWESFLKTLITSKPPPDVAAQISL